MIEKDAMDIERARIAATTLRDVVLRRVPGAISSKLFLFRWRAAKPRIRVFGAAFARSADLVAALLCLWRAKERQNYVVHYLHA